MWSKVCSKSVEELSQDMQKLRKNGEKNNMVVYKSALDA